jgi:hypothetical protein
VPESGWATWREALRIVAAGENLRRTACVALVVGTVLFAINQLDVVIRGEATPGVSIKASITFVVPSAW